MISALLLAGPLLVAVPTAPPVVQHEPQQSPDQQIDFANEEERMTVPVTIGGNGPYRFVVDSGAERTVISRELATTLGLRPGRGVRVTAMAGSADVATVVVPDIAVGSSGVSAGLRGMRIEAPALVQSNLGAAGLVGIDTLQGHALTIDFAKRTMRVAVATKRTRNETFGPDDIVIHARNRLGQLIVTDATYRGRKIRVVIDTGSVVSMGNFALRKVVAPAASALRPVRLLSVTGTVFGADYAVAERVTIGDVGFDHLPIAFSNAPPFARLGFSTQPALLLGMDALRLFGRVRLDFANREVRLARPTDVGTF